MRPYEAVLILDSTLEDSAVQSTLDRARDLVASKDGSFGQVEKWGRRRFAYEMNHRWEGYYVLVEMSANPDAVAELDRMLNLSDEVLRHKIVRIPDVVAGRSKPAASSESASADAATPGAES